MATTNNVLLVNLQHAHNYEGVGAKSANLAKTMEMGLSVPPGCVITQQALNLFLKQNGLFSMAQELIEANEWDDVTRTAQYETLCEAVQKAPIPQSILEAVIPSIQTLLDGSPNGLAVRSSGVHEDSGKASFAGVYESFLGIRSETDLWRAIRNCWCASWSRHAIDYARRMDIQPTADGISVLIQSLVPADSAGVLFTADPLTGNPWRFVLESTFGLAQDLVGSTGTTPADRFLFEWDTGEILSQEIAKKKTALFPTNTNINNINIPPDQQSEPSLSNDLATQIAQVGLQLDRAFGTRVDIEWVVKENRIYIVQVRPITALPSFFPHHLPMHASNETWSLAPGLLYLDA